MSFPRFRPVGDRAVLAEFAQTATDAAQEAVWLLDRQLAAHPIAGIEEAVPAYTSLLVSFDPLTTDHAAVIAALCRLLVLPRPEAAPVTPREVAVCYDPPFAPDLAAVARLTGLPPEAVIEAHLAGAYRVAMYGFAPGYAYLAGLPEAIRLPRKPAAVRDVPAGSVIIAGAQCLVTTLTMPTGWWIIGRSPTRILCPEGARPFLFDPGDPVRFRRVPPSALGA